jgi:2-hydroxychromene-2-carboxylate isomerase
MQDNSIDFYFDFSSPYAYLASERIEAIADRHGRSVTWHPVLLGAIYKLNGVKPLVDVPLVGAYSLHDFARAAREHEIPFHMPELFPINGVAASRAFLWQAEQDRELAVKLLHDLFRAYFVDGLDISQPDVVAAEAGKLGIDKTALLAAMQDEQVKALLRTVVEAAIERGVCGSPFMVADGEPFWGNDRLDQLDRWLETGGW